MELRAFGQYNAALISGLILFLAIIANFYPRVLGDWPIQNLGRVAVSCVARSRKLFYSCLALVLIALGYACLIIHCLVASDLYRQNIYNLVLLEDVNYAVRAFEAYSERSEVYLAVNYILSHRRTDVEHKQKFAEDFITGIDFVNFDGKQTWFSRWLDAICPCMIGAPLDPLVSASLIAPDATPRKRPAAVRIHNHRNYTQIAQTKMIELRPESWHARMYAHILHPGLAYDNASSLSFSHEREFLDALNSLIDEESNDFASHLYQEALSQIGSNTLAQCLKGVIPESFDIERTVDSYKQVLLVREYTYSEVPRWTRSPAKMTVFALFMTLYGLPPGPETDYASLLKENRKSCEPLIEALRAEFDQKKYDTWREAAAWYRGTVYQAAFRGRIGFWNYVEQSLRQGWKY